MIPNSAINNTVNKTKKIANVVYTFEAKPDSIKELERIYRITDEVIKFIVVRLED